jgi:ankyrin repeat protein
MEARALANPQTSEARLPCRVREPCIRWLQRARAKIAAFNDLVCELPPAIFVNHVGIEALKKLYPQLDPELQKHIISYLIHPFERTKEGRSHFSGLEIMEVLGNPSKEFLQLVSDIAKGKSEDYQSLLKRNPRLVREQDNRGKTPVHYALSMLTSSKGPSALKFLDYIFTPEHKELSKFLPLSLPDDKGNLPVHLIAKQLLQLDTKRSAPRADPIDQSLYEGALLLAGKIASYNSYLLQIPNRQGQTPLHFLVDTPNLDILRPFFSEDFSIYYSHSVYSDIFPVDLPAGTAFSTPFYTRIHELYYLKRRAKQLRQIALRNRMLKTLGISTDELKAEIAANRDLLDTENANGATLLYDAVQSHHLTALKVLIEAGANLNIANHDGETPVDAAIRKGNFQILKELIDHGANLQTADGKGKVLSHEPRHTILPQITDQL